MKQLFELTESYAPEKVLYREDQIEKLMSLFENFSDKGVAENLILMGGHGTGKTSTINSVLNQVGEKRYLMASGSHNYTCYKLLKSLFDFNCNTLERLIPEAVKYLKANPKVLIIDEINKLKDKVQTRLLFSTLNTISRETDCPLILITNLSKNYIKDIIPRDANFSQLLEQVKFQPYDPTELSGIMKNRIDLINSRNPKIEIPERSIPEICAYVVRFGEGSARVCREILKRCIVKNDFSSEQIKRTVEWLAEEDEREFLDNELTETEKRFVKALIDFKDKNTPLNSANFYQKLKENSLTLFEDRPYGNSRISNIITLLESRGFIKTKEINKGRGGGRYREIYLNKTYLSKIENVVPY